MNIEMTDSLHRQTSNKDKNMNKKGIRKLVVAGNYDQYMQWLRDENEKKSECVYVTRPKDIAGIRRGQCKLIFTGEYEKNEMYEEVMNQFIR